MDRYPDYNAIIDWHEGSSEVMHELDPVLHVSEPVLLGREREYVLDCLHRRWLTQGRYVARLERAFEEVLGRRFAIACNSGTSALHLAMLGRGVTRNNVVLVPALTYIATANAVKYVGAEPMFVDVDRKTWCMDPADVERKVKRAQMMGLNVVGCIVVHLYNALADVDAIKAVLPKDAFLVEDAAQGLGGMFGDNVPAGGRSDIAAFSFYGSKTVAAGEGGMVVTDNEVTAETMRLFRGQGAPRTGVYEHHAIGYNYRMTDISAAIALAQFETVSKHLQRRLAVVKAYAELVPPTGCELQEQTPNTRGGLWSVGVILPKGANRDAVRERMLEANVETRPFFIPIPYTEVYRVIEPKREGRWPIASHVAGRGISLPTHAGMTEADVVRAVDALTKALG